MACDEPNEAHADHYQHQDSTPEVRAELELASMILGQILRRGYKIFGMSESSRKNVIFKDASLKTRIVLEGWYSEKNSTKWNRVSSLGGRFSEGSVERSGQTAIDDSKAIFGAIHTNMGSRYCIILFCGKEFNPRHRSHPLPRRQARAEHVREGRPVGPDFRGMCREPPAPLRPAELL